MGLSLNYSTYLTYISPSFLDNIYIYIILISYIFKYSTVMIKIIVCIWNVELWRMYIVNIVHCTFIWLGVSRDISWCTWSEHGHVCRRCLVYAMCRRYHDIRLHTIHTIVIIPCMCVVQVMTTMNTDYPYYEYMI